MFFWNVFILHANHFHPINSARHPARKKTSHRELNFYFSSFLMPSVALRNIDIDRRAEHTGTDSRGAPRYYKILITHIQAPFSHEYFTATRNHFWRTFREILFLLPRHSPAAFSRNIEVSLIKSVNYSRMRSGPLQLVCI